ncbi:MAG: PHP domain-containing protein [Dehalococcoidia bacterium]|nr:MAG: PHP domain-containing protein [Dehalococcoidia bacterium]
MKCDLHVHTMRSPDSKTTPEQIISRCKKTGIYCIAVTDHNTIAGAVELKRIAPFKVIVSSEIHTRDGEVIGYFLSEEIQGKLPALETVRLIKEQGGLVCVPHPFDTMRGSAIERRALDEILSEVDIIETFNARSINRRHNTMARRFAAQHKIPASAGSDAHTPDEIGKTYVEMPDFNGKDDFLKALAQGKIVGQSSSPLVHLSSTWARIRKV